MAPVAEESSEMQVDTPAVDSSKQKVANPSASAESASAHPDMSLAQSIHQMTVIVNGTLEDPAAVNLSSDLSEIVMKKIAGPEVENPSLYRHLKEVVLKDSTLELLSEEELTAVEERHRKTLEELEAKVEDAKENAGEMEVLAARFEVARFAARSLSKEEAMAAYDKILALPKLSSGKIIDVVMESARVASFHDDTKKNGELVEKVCELINLLGYLI